MFKTKFGHPEAMPRHKKKFKLPLVFTPLSPLILALSFLIRHVHLPKLVSFFLYISSNRICPASFWKPYRWRGPRDSLLMLNTDYLDNFIEFTFIFLWISFNKKKTYYIKISIYTSTSQQCYLPWKLIINLDHFVH